MNGAFKTFLLILLSLIAFFWVAVSYLEYIWFNEANHTFQSILISIDDPHVILLCILFAGTYLVGGIVFFRILKRLETERNASRQSEENLHTTLNSIGDAVIATDTEGYIVRMNPVAEKLTGWALDDVRNRPLTEFFHIMNSQTRKPVDNPVKLVLERGEIVGLANHSALVAKDGTVYQISDSAAPIRDAEGQVKGVVLVFRDVTEAYRIQREKEESERKLSALFSAMTEMVVLHELVFNERGEAVDYRITDCNHVFSIVTGISRASAIGRLASEVYAADPPPYLDVYVQVGKTGNSCEFTTFYPPMNKYFAISVVSPFPNQFATITTDITGMKRAEESLRESESRLRESQKMAHLGNWYFDIHSGGVVWSEEVYKIFRLDPNEFKPHIRSILELSPWPEDHERDQEIIRKARESREQGSYEQRFLRPDGSTGYYFSTFQGIYDDHGELTALKGTVQDITERKLSEVALKNSEALYSSLVENLPQNIFRKDIEGNFTFVNDNFCATVGMSRQEIIGKTDYDLYPAEHAGKYQHDDRNVIETGQPIDTIEENVTASGEKRFVQVQKTPLKDSAGETIGIQGIFWDITQRLQIEQALRKNEHFLQDVFNAIQAGLSVLDRELNIVRANEWMHTMYAHEALLEGKKCYSVYQNRDSACPWCPTLKAMHTGETQSKEVPYPNAEDIQGWFDLSAFPLRNEEGTITGVIEYVKDISMRKKAEAALRNSETLYSSLVENLPQNIFRKDLAGKFTFVNGNFCKTIGQSQNDIIGKTDYDFFPPELAEKYQRDDRNVIETGQLFDTVEENVTPNGERRFVQVLKTPLKDSTGKTIGIQGIFWDITERKRAEELTQQEKVFSDSIINSLPGIFYLFNESGNFLRWNRNFEKISGYSSEELTRLHPLDLFEGTDKELIRQRIEDVFTDGKADTEAYICSKNGTRTPYYFTGRRIQLNAYDCIIGVGMDITARKSAEEALRESETKHRRLFETMAQGVIYQNADGQIISANPAAERILGLPFERLREKTSEDSNWESVREDSSELPGRDHPSMVALRTGKPVFSFVMGIKNQYTGLRVWISVSAVPLFHPGETEPFQVYTTFSDITERKMAETQLRLHSLVLNQIEDRVTVTDLNGVITYVNEAEVRTLGYSREELIGASTEKYGEDPKRGATQREIVDETLRHGYWRGEVVNFTADGRVIFLDCRTQVVYNHRGEKIALCGVSTDITERKKAEQERERLIMAIEQAAEIIVITDTEGTIQYVNPAFERITGYKREEAIGKNPRLLKSGHHQEDFYQTLWDTLTRGETWTGRFVNKKKDGTLYTEEAVISPVRDRSGRTVNYVAVKRDVTEENKLEEQLRQAQKMESVGRLAGGVAHDFNNMLGVIIGHAEMALNRVEESSQLSMDLQQIMKAAQRSADLTRQLLAFARKQTVSLKVLNLNDTVEGMLKMLQRLIGEDIDLRWLPKTNLWSINMDPSQIDQLLANLCVNARDAISGVGKITIETDNTRLDEVYCKDHIGFLPGEFVQLSVSDTGTGMDKETLSHIFDPFFTTKSTGEGTGLGLSTVYGIVKQNRGFINVYSEPGQGTTFKIYLPRHVGKADRIQPTPSMEPDIRGHETVLLVEDEPSLLELGQIMLENVGYQVLTAGTPGEAIELANNHAGEIHLLITDVVMPEMNGRELAKRLLSLYPNLKRLFMSGYTANVIAHHGVLDQGMHFLQKPFTHQALTAKVREVLDSE